jgi:hypothetical protein
MGNSPSGEQVLQASMDDLTKLLLIMPDMKNSRLITQLDDKRSTLSIWNLKYCAEEKSWMETVTKSHEFIKSFEAELNSAPEVVQNPFVKLDVEFKELVSHDLREERFEVKDMGSSQTVPKFWMATLLLEKIRKYYLYNRTEMCLMSDLTYLALDHCREVTLMWKDLAKGKQSFSKYSRYSSKYIDKHSKFSSLQDCVLDNGIKPSIEMGPFSKLAKLVNSCKIHHLDSLTALNSMLEITGAILVHYKIGLDFLKGNSLMEYLENAKIIRNIMDGCTSFQNLIVKFKTHHDNLLKFLDLIELVLGELADIEVFNAKPNETFLGSYSVSHGIWNYYSQNYSRQMGRVPSESDFVKRTLKVDKSNPKMFVIVLDSDFDKFDETCQRQIEAYIKQTFALEEGDLAFSYRKGSVHVEVEIKSLNSRIPNVDEMTRQSTTCPFRVKEIVIPPDEAVKFEFDRTYDKFYGHKDHVWNGTCPDRIPRGNVPYFCPIYWTRLALKTENFDAKYSGWHVAYAPSSSEYCLTLLENVTSIFRQGSILHGVKLTLSPCINYISHPKYSPICKTTHNGSDIYYQFVLQCRVKPNSFEKMKSNWSNFRDSNYPDISEMEWVVSESTYQDVVVPYGIMVRVTVYDPLIPRETTNPSLFPWWENPNQTVEPEFYYNF